MTSPINNNSNVVQSTTASQPATVSQATSTASISDSANIQGVSGTTTTTTTQQAVLQQQLLDSQEKANEVSNQAKRRNLSNITNKI
jgi:hypothetical protein